MPRADLRRAQRQQPALSVAESEARHRALVDALPEPVVLQDVDGSVILANLAARVALGIAEDGSSPSGAGSFPRQTGPAEAPDSDVSDLSDVVDVTDADRVLGQLRAGAVDAVRTGMVQVGVRIEVHHGDSPVVLTATHLPLIGDDGRAGAVVTRLQEPNSIALDEQEWDDELDDVVDLRDGSDAEDGDDTDDLLAEVDDDEPFDLPRVMPLGSSDSGTDELFRHAMQYSPIGFGVAALNGRFLRVNRKLCRMLGYRADELQERTVYDIVNPADLEETSLQIGHLIRGDLEAVTLERRYVGHGGMQLWGTLSVALIRDEHARPVQFVVQIEDVSEVHRAQELLTHMTLHDRLSGLPNRTLVIERIREALDRSRRSGRRVAVLQCDVDHFRVINDSAGQEQGDVMLAEIGRRVARALRSGDTAGRTGGDEFVVVCPEVSDETEAIAVAEHVQQSVGTPLYVGDRAILPSVSIGIALSTSSEIDPVNLLRDAEIATYRAKDSGRNRWDLVDSGLRRAALERLDLEQGLRGSLQSGDLELHFQPIVDLDSRAVVGREALLRWNHPERGLLAPGHFLHVAEESGLMSEIGLWVLTEAARVAAASPADGGYVSINVSPSQVTKPGLAASVEKALVDSGLAADRLMVELTESVMLSSAPSARREIELLDEIGVKVLVDDFGTGFGALSYLRDLPISGIKVDRSFTAGMGTDRSSERIVEALTGLGRGLGVDVIVEGVETEQQRDLLSAIGTEHAQGYLFGRPEPVLT